MNKNSLIQNGMYKNESMWDMWMHSTTEFVFFKDINGMYIAFSDAAANLYGFDAKDVIGKYDYEIYPPHLVKAFLNQDKTVINTKKRYITQSVFKNKDGREMIVETIKAPLINSYGEVIGIQGSARDISDRLVSQEEIKNEKVKIQALLDNIPIAVWIKDADNKYLTVNQEYENLFNVKKENIIRNDVTEILKTHDLFSEEQIELLKKQDEFVLNQKQRNKIEFSVTKDDKQRYFEFIKAPIIRDDKVTGLVGICNDITHS